MDKATELFEMVSKIKSLIADVKRADGLPSTAKYRVEKIRFAPDHYDKEQERIQSMIIDEMKATAIKVEVAAANVARRRELARIAVQVDGLRAALCDAAAKAAVELGAYSRELREQARGEQ